MLWDFLPIYMIWVASFCRWLPLALNNHAIFLWFWHQFLLPLLFIIAMKLWPMTKKALFVHSVHRIVRKHNKTKNTFRIWTHPDMESLYTHNYLYSALQMSWDKQVFSKICIYIQRKSNTCLKFNCSSLFHINQILFGSNAIYLKDSFHLNWLF